MGIRPGSHRLSMDIPDEMWAIIVEMAEKRNITITKLIKQILFNEIIKEQKYE